MHRKKFLALASALLLSGGCSSLGTLRTPELTLVDLQLVDATLFETTLQASLRIANPNPEPISLDGATFKLGLEGVKVARGVTSQSVIVPRLATEVVGVTFHLSNAALVFSLRDVLQRESLNYRLRGRLYVQGALGTRKIKVARDGQLTLPRRAAPAQVG